jgi:acyl carrier protein
MTPDTQLVEAIIAGCLLQLREDLSLPALQSVNGQTPLLGQGTDMDSMAIVHLIVDLEAQLEETFKKNWILADERALSRKRSPFRSVGDLAEFILETTPEA